MTKTTRNELGKKLALLLVICMLSAHLPVFTMTIHAAGAPNPTPISTGSGTANDPFIIRTADELAYMAQRVNARDTRYSRGHFRLANDINLSAYGAGWNNGRGWMPIGANQSTNGAPFSGVFDGGNHTIYSLYVNHPANRPGVIYGDIIHVGLFASVYNGTVKNLNVEGVVIATGHAAVGGVVGCLSGIEAELINVHFDGIVRGRHGVGGVVGFMVANSITTSPQVINSSSRGEVTADELVGGIVGRMFGGTIDTTSSNAIVVGNRNVGGIAGWIDRGRVTNSVALNPFVQANEATTVGVFTADVGRVIGHMSVSATLYGNRALANMGTNGGTPFPTPPEIYNVHNNRNGADWGGIVVGTAAGLPGEIVEVPVSFIGNPGIAGFNLTLGFDSRLVTPLAVTRSDSLGGAVFIANINENNDDTIAVVWASTYDVRASELFTIRFRINDITMDGDDIITPVPVSVIDALTESRADLAPQEHGGHIRITSPGAIGLLWGDVNVDGVVDTLDITLLAQHLAGVPGSRPCDTGLRLADVDRNNRVNVGDLILIAQYVADWDNSRGIQLGIPQ
ncbi:MAG: dockerin type I domain-containing protein [Defluviitaleaceae bacterium]|nr:dockerin type I domain-containing protein [Defluviitaleaceae bacterium]